MALAASASAFGVAARAPAPSRASSGSRAALRGVALARLAARAARTAAQCPSPFAPTATCLRAGLPPRSPATTENNALDTTSRSLTDERARYRR